MAQYVAPTAINSNNYEDNHRHQFRTAKHYFYLNSTEYQHINKNMHYTNVSNKLHLKSLSERIATNLVS